MNTIKIMIGLKDYKDQDDLNSKATLIFEGYDLFHRPVSVSNLDEYENFCAEYAIFESGIKHILGDNPAYILKERKEGNLDFEYLSFIDNNNNYHKCILIYCSAYIMNDKGQTIDTIIT